MSTYSVILPDGKVKEFRGIESARKYARENGGRVHVGYIRNENQIDSPSLKSEYREEIGQKASDLIYRP